MNAPKSGTSGITTQGISGEGTEGNSPGASPSSGPISQSSEGYQIEYENAPVGAVAKSIIAETLKLGLTVDPRVSGTVSLSSGQPLKKDELIIALENALKTANAVLLKDINGYRVVPAGETLGSAAVDGATPPAPGYGITVLPLRYVSADTIMKLVDSFATKPGAVRVETTQNLLLILGSSEERKAALETAKSFDKDWMRGQSVGIYPVVNAEPATIIVELQRIMDSGEGGAGRGLVQFQPVERLNAVMAITRRAEVLKSVKQWVERLDKADNTASLSRVYRVKYGSAKHLAKILNDAFGAGGTGGAADSTEPGMSRVSMGTTGGGLSGGSLGSTTGGGTTGGGGYAGISGAGLGAGGQSPAGTPSGVGGANSTMGEAAGSVSGSQFVGTFARQEEKDDGMGGRPTGKVKITPDVKSNSLLIFADREHMKMIERVLEQLDKPALQVAIEATIAEVTLNDGLAYGVQYYLENTNPHPGSIGFSTLASGALKAVNPGFNFILGSSTDPRVVLDALNTRTSVKLLSNPSIVVRDNEVASIQVGDQVPVTISQVSLVGTTSGAGGAFPVANNIEYRNTGVILRVLPRVTANGHVMLDVEQEISQVANLTAIGSGSLTPTVKQRVIKSSVSVMSGQTVLLGGLIGDVHNTERQGLPILSNIDIIGDVFGHTDAKRQKTELIVFIRPKILQTGSDAQDVAEIMRNKMIFSYQPPFQP
ncbi:MAG: type II secretion system secretin GspD [Hyphomicrobium sp.]